MKKNSPPFAQESEQAVIGCCIQSPKVCIAEAQMVLSSDYFYDVRCQMVWELMIDMPVHDVNTITVCQMLKDKGLMDSVQSIEFLTVCQDFAYSTANLSTWLNELKEKFILRKIISTCSDAIGKAYEFSGSGFEFLDCIERDILAIRPNQRAESGIKALVHQAINKIEEKCQTDNISGLETGLMDLDKLTDGIHKGEMIVIGGFPSTGKTALAVGIAVTNALKKIPVAIFTAEMRPVQLVVRSICSESRVNFYKVCYDDIPSMTVSASKIANAPLHIEQAHGLSIGQVIATARRLKQKFGIQMAVIDYMQLLLGTGDNREQTISSISKGIKAMALELDIPVLALSQLTDDGQLRESRAIGQDADTVWKLKNVGEWMPLVQPIQLNVEKCRDGSTGSINLVFKKEFTRFETQSKIQHGDIPSPYND